MIKRKCFLPAVGISLLLTGCAGSLPDMTDDQINTVSEYAAITLLKYDAGSKSRLVDISVLEQQAAAETNPVVTTPDPVQPQQPDQPDQTVIDRTGGQGGVAAAASLEEFLGLPEGVSLTYANYQIAQNYQEGGDMYFALEASAGKELLILSFVLDNQSGTDQSLRLIDQHNSYRVSVNGEYTRTALTTLLDNDLSTFIGNIGAGDSRALVLLYEIDPDKVGQVETITLQFKNTEQTYALQVL